MIWTILQTIGSLLSGISILTAFILYRIEQNDKYNKDIRKAIADTVTTIEEQYSLLKSNFIFSYVEEFFSNRYFRQYLSDLGAYIESHIDKNQMKLRSFAISLIDGRQCLILPYCIRILFRSSTT